MVTECKSSSGILRRLKQTIRPQLHSQDLCAQQAVGQSTEACVYAFGSSSTEVLDYVFGASPRYKSFWASGWSGRGLRREKNRAFVLGCLKSARPQDIILLHFGVVDAVFNAAYRVQQGDFLDPEGFCREAAEGVAMLVEGLKQAGFENVYALSVAAPVKLPPMYFRKKFNMQSLPIRYQVQLLRRVMGLIGERCQLIDMLPELGGANGILKPEFCRGRPNHHADYTKIQARVWERLHSEIPGLPPHRPVWRETLYRPGKRGGIKKRMSDLDHRPVDLKRFELERRGKE